MALVYNKYDKKVATFLSYSDIKSQNTDYYSLAVHNPGASKNQSL
jgi:hypothetical protein